MTSAFEVEFEKFWAQTSGRISAFMFCACESRADTDDLVQECYLRALRGWGQFSGRGSRQAWLFRIAQRTRADYFRQKRKNEPVAHLQSTSELGTGLKESSMDRTETVWEAVKSLDNKQGEVIHLRFAAGLGYLDIAEALIFLSIYRQRSGPSRW